MSLIDLDTILIPAPHLGDGGVLEVDCLWQDAHTTAILCHPNPVDGGTMNNKVVSTLYRYARDKGFNVIRYNSRGVGRSSGVATASLAEFDDAKCVLTFAMAKGARHFWLGGFSFGGFMACCLADFIQKSDSITLDKLCLIAPSIVKHDVRNLNLPFNKTFLIYGDEDKLVSPLALEKFALDNHIAYQVLNTGHFFHGQLSQLKESIAQLDK